MTAEIEDIDLNLFTGELAVVNARGQRDQGTGFDIAKLRVNLDYWPLFSGQIHLANLELHDSRIEVEVDDAGDMNVAGFDIPPGDDQPRPEQEQTTPWSFALERAERGTVAVRYRQPGFDREITLSSKTSGIDSADADNAFPIDMQVAVADSRIALAGELKPFGERIRGDLKLTLEDFDLDRVAPLAEQADISKLAGIIHGTQAIDLDYHADEGIKLGMDGGLTITGAQVVTPALRLAQADLEWNGQIAAQLLQAAADADRVTLDGILKLGEIDAALPDTLTLAQQSVRWQGKIVTRLGPPLAIAADGGLVGKGLAAWIRSAPKKPTPRAWAISISQRSAPTALPHSLLPTTRRESTPIPIFCKSAI